MCGQTFRLFTWAGILPGSCPLLTGSRLADTVRVSLTGDPVQEVTAAYELLGALGLRRRGPLVYSCPTCGRTGIGVINLTDALNADRFTGRDRKLVTAVAAQVGAAIENARLAAREREQQRLEDELQLAHDLQQKLMPDPDVLQGEAQVAARCLPVASVGGDFYTFQRLAEGRIGIMLGDVSTHGLSAALVMALVLAAAGIHTAAATGPAETLRKLRQSLLGRPSDTEMYASTFYAVLDRKSGRLRYANAGHPHAFLIGADGAAERLEATAPPLGLGVDGPIGAAQATAPLRNAEVDLLFLQGTQPDRSRRSI